MTQALYAGPWSWDGSYPIRVVDYAGYIVCEGIMPARHRDACLISAAPELLEALRKISFLLSATNDDPGEPSFMPEVRAAIAKAEGQS